MPSFSWWQQNDVVEVLRGHFHGPNARKTVKESSGDWKLHDAIKTKSKDPLEIEDGSIKKLWTKKLIDTFNGHIQNIWIKINFKKITSSTSNDQTLVNLIYLQERSNSSISWAT